MRRRIIGVTGPMQSGKQELLPVWRQLGFTTLDCNPWIDEVHRRDRNDFYTELGLAPVGLTEDGRETFFYYQKLFRLQQVHRRAQAHETAFVHQQLTAKLEAMSGSEENIVVSWGYVYQLLQRGVHFDHVFVFQSERSAWLKRMHKAIPRLGWTGDPFTDAEVLQFATALDLDPEVIKSIVVQQMDQNCWSLVDSSDDDWGEANLRQELLRLGW